MLPNGYKDIYSSAVTEVVAGHVEAEHDEPDGLGVGGQAFHAANAEAEVNLGLK